MQPMSSKYTLWILVLLCVAVLQGIAISRDGFFVDRPKALLSASEDFTFLSPVNKSRVQGLIPVSMVASVYDTKTRSHATKNQILNHELDEFKQIQNYLEEEIEEPSVDNIEGKFELDLDGLTEKLSQEVSEEPVTVKDFNKSGLHTAAEGYITHTVKRGETLSKVAKMYDMTVSQLVLYNGIMNPDHIYPGYQLQIAFDKIFNHEVKIQETLWSISRLYGVSVDKN